MVIVAYTLMQKFRVKGQSEDGVETNGRAEAMANFTGSCERTVRVRVNLTESCPNSINVDRNVFAWQLRPTVLYKYVYEAIATKPAHSHTEQCTTRGGTASTIPQSYILRR